MKVLFIGQRDVVFQSIKKLFWELKKETCILDCELDFLNFSKLPCRKYDLIILDYTVEETIEKNIIPALQEKGYSASQIILSKDFLNAMEFNDLSKVNAKGIAHDFNNLLTIIEGHTHLALKHAGDSFLVAKNLSKVQKAIRRAGDLTAALSLMTQFVNLKPIRLKKLNQQVQRG